MKSDTDALLRCIADFRETTQRAIEAIEEKVHRLQESGEETADDHDQEPDGPSLRLPATDSTAPSAGEPRLHQMKVAMTLGERLKVDAMANAMSEACRSRVSVTNLIRAAVIVLHKCEPEIVDEVRSISIRRPHNHDLNALDAFEYEIARLIARAAKNCRLP